MNLIAAINHDHVIDFKPSREDLMRYQALTVGGDLIVGRRTFELLPESAKKHRKHIVLTRQDPKARWDITDWEKRYPHAWVIGGSETYSHFLFCLGSEPAPTRLYLSRFHSDVTTGLRFPVSQEFISKYYTRIVLQHHGDHDFEIWESLGVRFDADRKSPVLKVYSAAMKATDGKLWYVPPPGRHPHIIRLMTTHGAEPKTADQGFLLTDGTFVSRKEAAKVAVAAGQITQPKWGPALYSEDLW